MRGTLPSPHPSPRPLPLIDSFQYPSPVPVPALGAAPLGACRDTLCGRLHSHREAPCPSVPLFFPAPLSRSPPARSRRLVPFVCLPPRRLGNELFPCAPASFNETRRHARTGRLAGWLGPAGEPRAGLGTCCCRADAASRARRCTPSPPLPCVFGGYRAVDDAMRLECGCRCLVCSSQVTARRVAARRAAGSRRAAGTAGQHAPRPSKFIHPSPL